MHIMIDLETMGTRTSSAIIAIGACVFDINGIHADFYTTVSLADNLRVGRTVDASTILWWLKQSDAARAEFSGDCDVSLYQALRQLRELCNQLYIDGVWGNGSDFDCAMLADAYQQVCGEPTPWHFATTRDLRTLRALAPDVPRIPFDGEKHNALADARNQALHAIEIMKYLRREE